MNFIEEVIQSIGENEFLSGHGFRAVLFERAGYFQAIKCIREYRPEEIIFCSKHGEIRVLGENLYIKKYCAGDVVVCGKITALERY